MLNITIDELMENNSKSQKKKKKIIVFIILIFIIILIALLLLIIFINPKDEEDQKNKINETEEILNIKLPKVKEYDLVEYSSWLTYNNTMYPNKLFYFGFENEIIKVDDTWFDELPQNIIDNIPVGSSEYPYICDYFKLVDLNTNAINKIEKAETKHKYILYCLQIENKRLIAIEFEV